MHFFPFFAPFSSNSYLGVHYALVTQCFYIYKIAKENGLFYTIKNASIAECLCFCKSGEKGLFFCM